MTATERCGQRAAPARPVLAETAYELIKRGIIRCELAPDQQVTEEQLGARFGVGRAAVRAALKRLYQEQLVQSVARNRYVIAPITLQHVNELYALRLLLEPAAARMAAGRIEPDVLQRLRILGQVRYRTGDGKSGAVFLTDNTVFHATIASASGNALLASVIQDVLDKVERVLHMSHLLRNRNEAAALEHQELLDALAAGDSDWAERVMIEQILKSKQFAIESMIASPSLLSANVVLQAK